MRRMHAAPFRLALLAAAFGASATHAASPRTLKTEAEAGVEAQAKQIQVMVDQVFSFAEPGFQEIRTSAYLEDILEKAGFTVTRGVAGIPTAFTATWGSGGPLIALGSDIDDLLGVSQMPGVPTIKPMIPGAPGHGEGHNTGMPAIIAAAISAKQVMEKNHIPGRLLVWPGVAEELLGTKAYYVRSGMFKGVDATIFMHVGYGEQSDFSTDWGDLGYNAMVSVEYNFHGKTAHAAGDPWDGRSALDGVELMDVAWNYRREHLPVTQRSHYVITRGGGQPNVVPDQATVWYYYRDRSFADLRTLFETGNTIAEAAAQASGTTVDRRILGYAAPAWGNRPLAEAAYANIKAVGMPRWTPADQAFTQAAQQANGRKLQPLTETVAPLGTPESRGKSLGGGSDDIGDIMWTVPTITIRYPANIPNMIGHHATSAMSMATPIAHKGALAGAKAVAMTVIDMVTQPRLIADAKTWFETVQLKTDRYDPLIGPGDKPAIWLNEQVMRNYRPAMEKFYYDPARYPTYLDQLGVAYPAAPAAPASGVAQ
jgi:aminobenzoyl-glutamate utilization protein B